MIVGQVNTQYEAIVPLTLLGSEGQKASLAAVIDTGFSGYVTLPLSSIQSLGFRYLESRQYSLGDNSEANLDLYEGVVNWDGTERTILIVGSEAHPLVGMSLLKGRRLTMVVLDGGEVLVTNP